MPELDEMSSDCFADNCDGCAKFDCTCMCHDDWFETGGEDEDDLISVTAVCTRCSIVESARWNGVGVPTCESCGQPYQLGAAI